MPNTTDVLKIEVMAGVVEQRKVVAEIAEKQNIHEILTIITSHNKKWHKPWATYPTPRATAVFRGSSNTPLLILWFGPNWAGGQDMPQCPKRAKLWGLEKDSLKALKRLLGIESV